MWFPFHITYSNFNRIKVLNFSEINFINFFVITYTYYVFSVVST